MAPKLLLSEMAVFVLVAIILLCQFRGWMKNNLRETKDTIEEDESNFFTILSSNNRMKIIYIDNEITEDSLPSAQNNFNISPVGNMQLDSSYYSDHSSQKLNNIEWDETLDYNDEIPPVEEPSVRKACSIESPLQNIVLVQNHYHGDEPFTNVMYRYGDLNQLTFALPKRSNFGSYWPSRFHPSFIDSSLVFTNHVHMLINAPYQHTTMKRYMKGSMIVAVIYDPVGIQHAKVIKHFRKDKAMNSRTKTAKHYKTLQSGRDTSTISFNFGYSLNFQSRMTPADIINELETQFDVVLMGDYVLESLVVLKNALCWSLNDLVFLSPKTEKKYEKLRHKIKSPFRTRNKLDQAIYEHFNQSFWEKVKSYGTKFTSDLLELRELIAETTNECSRKNKGYRERQRTLGIGEVIGDMEPLCKRLRWNENQYISYLKKKPPLFNQEKENGVKHLKEALHLFFNKTSQEILMLQSP